MVKICVDRDHNLAHQFFKFLINFPVEQYGSGPFNRAMLMNVGAAEALKQYDYQCFIFHDVDLLPEDDRNLVNMLTVHC